MKTYPLRKFVRRVLVARLGVATAVIAVVVGLATYAIQRFQLEREVGDLGQRGLASLLDRVRFTMEGRQTDALTALRDVLAHADRPLAYRAGRFVYIQVYDYSSTVLAEKAVADQRDMESVRAFMANRPHAFPTSLMGELATERIGRASFVLFSAPVLDRHGQIAAFVRGLFAVSSEEVALIRRAMVRNTLLVVGIALAAAALLYPVILRLADQLADYSTSLLDANLETLSVLGSAIAKRDSDTDAHNYRVTIYAVRIGEKMSLDAGQIRALIKGSFLHDVGKLGIPDNILLKPARLDAQEFSIMKTHVDSGAEIVARSSWLREGSDVVSHHHEKFAGGGYPHGLKGDDIPVAARIFAVADVFDALTSTRPYKKPLSFDETMALLEKERGTHFDPQVLDAFAGIARELFDSFGGRVGAGLRDELTAMVTKYFSAGMETLRY